MVRHSSGARSGKNLSERQVTLRSYDEPAKEGGQTRMDLHHKALGDRDMELDKGVCMCAQSQFSDFDHSSGEPPLGPRPTWLTAREAAQYLNLKVRTILLWARQGRVKAYALTGTQRRVWRFLQADLDAIVMQKKPVVSSAQPSVLAKERRI